MAIRNRIKPGFWRRGRLRRFTATVALCICVVALLITSAVVGPPILKPSTESSAPGLLDSEPAQTQPKPELEVSASQIDENRLARASSSRTSLKSVQAESPTRESPVARPPEAAATRAESQTQPDQSQQDRSDSSISGTVFDDSGAPVAGISVVYQFGTNPIAGASAGSAAGSSVTDRLGMFHFEQLPLGEYRLLVAETDAFHPASLAVRAGASSADLHLQRKGAISVHGRILDEDSEPLRNAWIRGLGDQHREISDSDGAYRIMVERKSAGAIPVLEFMHPDFATARRRIQPPSGAPDGEVELNVRLERRGQLAQLIGQVWGPDGEWITDAEVLLSSPGFQERTSTGNFGEYRFDSVESGGNYQLIVNPAGAEYARHVSSPLALVRDGRIYNVTLERSGQAELAGILLDLQGRPLTNFTLWIRAGDGGRFPPVRTVSDEAGRFGPVSTAAGNVILETHSRPLLVATGITLDPRESRFIELPLDWGKQWLFGRVVDAHGAGISRARITAQWNRHFSGIRSSSRRGTLTDLEGYFALSNLGGQRYQVTVQADGFEIVRVEAAPGAPEELVIELNE